jgi:hypothetical protein
MTQPRRTQDQRVVPHALQWFQSSWAMRSFLLVRAQLSHQHDADWLLAATQSPLRYDPSFENVVERIGIGFVGVFHFQRPG